MDYSEKTAALIERMCRIVERDDYVLDKEKAEACLLKTYDLFGLERPKKIKWHNDIFDEEYASSARSARSASSAWSAWSARSAWSASSASSALDYDFDWFTFCYEYLQNPDKAYPPNENDRLYLEYCELLIQANEYGMGYRVEWEDTLHLVPAPLVKIDTQNRFHSDTMPAIRWKDGAAFYYLAGVHFEDALWSKVVSARMTFSEILTIENTEQRLQAMHYNPNALVSENPKLVHKSERGNELYLIEHSQVNEIYDAPKVWLLGFIDPSKKAPNNKMYEEVSPEMAAENPDADFIQASHLGLSLRDYRLLEMET